MEKAVRRRSIIDVASDNKEKTVEDVNPQPPTELVDNFKHVNTELKLHRREMRNISQVQLAAHQTNLLSSFDKMLADQQEYLDILDKRISHTHNSNILLKNEINTTLTSSTKLIQKETTQTFN